MNSLADQAQHLISDEYRRLQQELHLDPDYGVASVAYAPLLAEIMQQLGTDELLDYGAGKGRLGQTLRQHIQGPFKVHHYDPAIAEWSASPAPCRLVACIDVLEHIEPQLLDNVLDDLQRVIAAVGILTVHTGPAIKMLPDGRNAHLTQQPAQWWLPKLMQRFELVQFNRAPNGFVVGVERKGP
jgi:hypothetical protein